ncbi:MULTISPECIES: hypothetical protein [unclassified Pseudomonas]|uniref:hypothetical protein n=1 Tax=Pseudomonas sp. BGI-2 TaxID=2528211 RepID=UPI001033DD23|nr:hypothetical protein [Pseudomonas sp. BGI-2]TBN46328.1 hypothetical protein EYC95_12840 [Pseudomonas sp. BGI-2]
MQKDNVPYGSDISAGRYACADCGHEYSGSSKKSMPPCPYFEEDTHTRKGWKVLTGQGDAVIDPYPEKTDKPVGIKQVETSNPASKK